MFVVTILHGYITQESGWSYDVNQAKKYYSFSKAERLANICGGRVIRLR